MVKKQASCMIDPTMTCGRGYKERSWLPSISLGFRPHHINSNYLYHQKPTNTKHQSSWVSETMSRSLSRMLRDKVEMMAITTPTTPTAATTRLKTPWSIPLSTNLLPRKACQPDSTQRSTTSSMTRSTSFR